VRDGRPFDAALARAADGLDDDDRRLAHEIAAGVLRARDELDGRLAPLVSGDWGGTAADLQDLLRIGAYQLLRLSRVPTYAAVQATVEVSKLVTGRKGAGLVNAVLRRLAREGEAAGDGTPAGLAQRYSHPPWLVDRWLSRYGAERTEALLVHNNARPKLVLRPARWSEEELREALTAREVPFEEAPFEAGLAVAPSRVWQLPGYGEGAFLVQDAAQARLLQFAAIPDGALVWDACAAPGGKAAMLGLRCRVVATELTAAAAGRGERRGRAGGRPLYGDRLHRPAPRCPVAPLGQAARAGAGAAGSHPRRRGAGARGGRVAGVPHLLAGA
jgi:16S rRNA (cytosine967-C5)-methyltransferase